MKKVDMKKFECSIYNEANELEIPCCAKVGIMVFSDEEALISSGNQSKLLNLEAPSKAKTNYCRVKDPQLANIIRKLNSKHDELLRQLEEEEKKEKRLEKMNAGDQTGCWTKPLKKLSLEELKRMEGVADNISSAPENVSIVCTSSQLRDSENAAETSTSSTVTNGNGN